jgi:Rad9-like protein
MRNIARDTTVRSTFGYVFASQDLQRRALTCQALISIFRSRAGGEPQRDREKDTSIDRCEVTIEDGESLSTRFIAKLIFRNGMASTHRMPFEVAVPVHAKFNREEATNHWTMPSRTLRQLMEHFGPGVELLDISSNGEHVKFTCFTEKTVNDGLFFQRLDFGGEADYLQRSSRSRSIPPSPLMLTNSTTLRSRTTSTSS